MPAGQALWIPSGIHHEVYSHGPVGARMLLVDRDHDTGLPTQSGTVTVSPLLAELVVRAIEYGNDCQGAVSYVPVACELAPGVGSAAVVGDGNGSVTVAVSVSGSVRCVRPAPRIPDPSTSGISA